mgnify:CR=1 FL=1
MNNLVLIAFQKAVSAGWSPPSKWREVFPEAFNKEEVGK